MRAGIMDADGKITRPATRLLNSDECPNPWRGTGDRGKLIAEVGKAVSEAGHRSEGAYEVWMSL